MLLNKTSTNHLIQKEIITLPFLYMVLMDALAVSLLELNTSFLDFLKSFGLGFFYSFVVLFFIFYSLAILGEKIYFKARALLFVLNVLIFILQIFLIFNFHTDLNYFTLEIMLATNPRETTEFLELYFNAKNILIIGAILLTSFLMIKIPFKITLPFSFCTVLYLLFLAIFFKNSIQFNFDIEKTIPKTSLTNTAQATISFFYKNNHIYGFYENARLIESYVQKKKDNPNYIKAEYKFPKIVLILGESTQRNYMSLYGYPLKTTPLLENLQKQNNLFVFNDVVSPGTFTSEVLSLLFTFKENKKKEITADSLDIMHTMNLIDAMKLLNYQTFWLSNQDAITVYGNIAQTFAKRADILRYAALLNSEDTKSTKALKDEVLLNIYDEMKLKESTPPQFIIFNLMGTHSLYRARYPQSFAKFTMDDLKENNLDKITFSKNKTVNNAQLEQRMHYVNAVYYNDFVVSQIMERFKNEEAIVFYLSDHGQNIYDDNAALGHAPDQISRAMVEIPFMIYLSDSFKLKHPKIVAKIQNALNIPFMTNHFPNALFDLLNFECEDLTPQFSLFHPDYQPKDRIIFSGPKFTSINYDATFKKKK